MILTDVYGTYTSYDKEDLITGFIILEAHLKGRRFLELELKHGENC